MATTYVTSPTLEEGTLRSESPATDPRLHRSTASRDGILSEDKDAEILGDGSEWKPGKQEYAIMFTIATVSLMVALDATILVPVLPTLAAELDGTTSDAFWAGTSYLLTCAVFQPFIAALSDLFGRKEMLLLSISFFTLGTLLCAPLAHNFTVLLAGRCLQGIGGGGIITMGQVIFADIIPLRQRPKYFSIVLGAWAVGSVLGPLIGGLLVEHASWKWCFYINFPFCALGFVMVPLFVKLKQEKTTLASKLARVDWLGGFLFIGGMTSFLVGISWAGVQYDWISAQVLAPFLLGLAAVFAAVMWEIFGAREPVIRMRLFGSVSAIAAFFCAFAQGFLLFCALYYLPFYFSALHLHGPFQSGLDLLPVTSLLVPGSIIVSFLTTRLGHFRWAIWAGWAITALGAGLFLLFDLSANTPVPVWAAILCVFGVGNGMVLTSVNVAIQAISRAEDCGRAASMYAFMRTLGMSIGVAIGGTAFQNAMSDQLADLGLPTAIANNAEGFVALMAAMDPEDVVRQGAETAYLDGFHAVFWVMTVIALLGLVVSLFIRSHSMDKALESQFVLEGSATTTAARASVLVGKGTSTSASSFLTVDYIRSSGALSPGGGDDEKTLRGSVVEQVSAQPNEKGDVVSFLVGPGGWRIPLDPRSNSPLPIPDGMVSQREALPTRPEPVREDRKRRISGILKVFS